MQSFLIHVFVPLMHFVQSDYNIPHPVAICLGLAVELEQWLHVVSDHPITSLRAPQPWCHTHATEEKSVV